VKLVELLGGMETAIPGNQLDPIVRNPANDHGLKLAIFLKGPGQGSYLGVIMCLPASVPSDHDLNGINQVNVLPQGLACIQLHSHLGNSGFKMEGRCPSWYN
jgi:hypothetical protein